MDSISSAIDDEFLTDEVLPNSEPVQVNTVTDKDIWTISIVIRKITAEAGQ